MQLTSVLFAAAALLAPVYSNPIIPMGRREAGLDVELASIPNTKVSEPSTASAANSIIHRRGTVDVDTCTKDQNAEVDAAVKRAASLSTAAADAAVNGDARIFEYYFRTTDTATRQEVAARFEAIANETSSVGGGKVTYNCGNGLTQSDCGDALAYAVPSKNMVVNCPSWYIIVPETDDCGGKDQGLAMIHELTHLGDVYSPPATDIAYGYDAIVSLSKEDAIVNADTYLYYASGECS
jgi:deuterolysin